MKKSILEAAKVIRSKNCSPFELTMDIIFREQKDYAAVKNKIQIDAKRIADLYNVPLSQIQKVIYFDPACAVKICMARPVPSGSPGDSDVYGAQQHAPLLALSIDV